MQNRYKYLLLVLNSSHTIIVVSKTTHSQFKKGAKNERVPYGADVRD